MKRGFILTISGMMGFPLLKFSIEIFYLLIQLSKQVPKKVFLLTASQSLLFQHVYIAIRMQAIKIGKYILNRKISRVKIEDLQILHLICGQMISSELVQWKSLVIFPHQLLGGAYEVWNYRNTVNFIQITVVPSTFFVK